MTQPSESLTLRNNQTPVTTLPFDVSSELNQYSKVYIAKDIDNFRLFHCFEAIPLDYRVFGELPDGDKKILFTARQHFQCCNCFDDCSINFCCCCEYMCCDRIVFQMDYKRNEKNFYTQGFNIPKGFYFCLCTCCLPNVLYLRENVDPDSKDFNVGIRKGMTKGTPGCCKYFKDKTVNYVTQDDSNGACLRMTCFDYWKHRSLKCCFHCFDINISIENGANVQIGNVTVPNGWCSKKVETKTCYFPGRHFEDVFPPGSSSEEKFQIIAGLIHFDLGNNILL